MDSNQEIFVLERFKTCYGNFPEGKVLKSEKPDFIIESPNKQIGLEITEVFQDSHEGHSRYQQRWSVRHKFTKKLILELQKFVDFTFHISVHFNDFKYLKKSREKELIIKTFKATINHLIQLENLQSVLIEDFRWLFRFGLCH